MEPELTGCRPSTLLWSHGCCHLRFNYTCGYNEILIANI